MPPVPCNTLPTAHHCSAGPGACPHPWPCRPCKELCTEPAPSVHARRDRGWAEAEHAAGFLRLPPALGSPAGSRAILAPQGPNVAVGRDAEIRPRPSTLPCPTGSSTARDPGGFVPNRTGRILFVFWCWLRPSILYFRYVPAAVEPNKPAPAVRGQKLRPARLEPPGSGSALPAAGWATPLGAAPQHRGSVG